MTELPPFLSALKLPNRTPKAKTTQNGDNSKRDAARPRDARTAPKRNRNFHHKDLMSTQQDMWPMLTIMFGLPSVPRAAPKSCQNGSLPTLSAFSPAPVTATATASKTLATSGSKDLPQQLGLAELEAPISTWPGSSSTQSSDSSRGYLVVNPGSETPSNLSNPSPMEPVELCAHQPVDLPVHQPVEPCAHEPVELPAHQPVEPCAQQQWADQPSNKVHNILKAMRTPVHSSRGGHVYCFEDANAPGHLRFGHTETWDEPWVPDTAASVVIRPDICQSNTLGKRIRQRKSTCGLWPVVKLVAPMECAAHRMETLVRLTLVDYREQQECRSGVYDDPELFNCSLDQAERVLHMWQRFSNLQPFTPSGQLEELWRKYAKYGLRGRWTGHSIDEWVSASLEPMLREMEEGDDRWANFKGFEPAQRSALQVILGSLGDQELGR